MHVLHPRLVPEIRPPTNCTAEKMVWSLPYCVFPAAPSFSTRYGSTGTCAIQQIEYSTILPYKISWYRVLDNSGHRLCDGIMALALYDAILQFRTTIIQGK
ncbi:hypothetical protein Vafri_3407 [Volvox africanus]|uniref:Uncharacterized protein n=1 Tax=Volvox africanus TaxID=51714 RepID=A0A8J4ARX0_9CHLO|nr:hypothetical protein Vafri_3407 [Volvox africanus]